MTSVIIVVVLDAVWLLSCPDLCLVFKPLDCYSSPHAYFSTFILRLSFLFFFFFYFGTETWLFLWLDVGLAFHSFMQLIFLEHLTLQELCFSREQAAQLMLMSYSKV